MSKAPKVLGTLSIVFGGLITAWSPLALFMGPLLKGMSSMVSAMPHQPGMRDPALDLGAAEAMLEAQQGYLRVTAAIMTVLSVALIVVGVGLLKRRESARKGAFAWSVLGLIALTVNSIVAVTWLQPMTEHVRLAYYEAHQATPPLTLGSSGSATGVILGWLFYAAFPIVLMAVLGRRAVAAEFTS
jgi:hypothetical protein